MFNKSTVKYNMHIYIYSVYTNSLSFSFQYGGKKINSKVTQTAQPKRTDLLLDQRKQYKKSVVYVT